uniref:Uncharacterized protein n=1 Tax=Bionectria ochroleuca TaxID=29856 RepID=A0A8H7N9D4_BIOOC
MTLVGKKTGCWVLWGFPFERHATFALELDWTGIMGIPTPSPPSKNETKKRLKYWKEKERLLRRDWAQRSLNKAGKRSQDQICVLFFLFFLLTYLLQASLIFCFPSSTIIMY